MKKLYAAANLEISNFDPDITLEKSYKSFDSEDDSSVKDFFFYSHSQMNNEMCFSDSSKYLSSLMRLPWQLNLYSDKFEGQTLGLITHVSFDPASWAIRLQTGNPKTDSF